MTMKVLGNRNFNELTEKKWSPSLQTGINTAKVHKVYDVKDRNIVIIDKENGGKADAVNIGINYAKGKYVCTIDADSVLDMTALKAVVKPFIKNPDTIVTAATWR